MKFKPGSRVIVFYKGKYHHGKVAYWHSGLERYVVDFTTASGWATYTEREITGR